MLHCNAFIWEHTHTRTHTPYTRTRARAHTHTDKQTHTHTPPNLSTSRDIYPLTIPTPRCWHSPMTMTMIPKKATFKIFSQSETPSYANNCRLPVQAIIHISLIKPPGCPQTAIHQLTHQLAMECSEKTMPLDTGLQC